MRVSETLIVIIILAIFLSVLLSTSSPVTIITHYADTYGVKREIPIAIALAESNLNPEAHNASSSASGIFEFLNGSFQYWCIDKYGITHSMEYKNYPAVQAKCAIRMLADGHIDAWNESSTTWKTLIKET